MKKLLVKYLTSLFFISNYRYENGKAFKPFYFFIDLIVFVIMTIFFVYLADLIIH